MSQADEVLIAVDGKVPNRRGWVRGNCPFCLLVYGKDDRTQALGLNVRTGRWRCFRCEERGYIKPSRIAAGALLPDNFDDDGQDGETVIEAPLGFMPLGSEPARSAMATSAVREYLLGRGIPESTWVEAGIGTTLSGKFAHRVIVPITRPDGQWVGYVGRSTAPNPEKRYLNSLGRIDGMLNEAALYVETTEPLLVVEGAFDALPFWPGAAALLGKPSGLQIEMLLQARRPLAVCLDGDAWREGEALAWRLLFDGKQAGAVKLPPTRDPDDCRAILAGFAQACIEGGYDTTTM